jgi:hypothetical protein
MGKDMAFSSSVTSTFKKKNEVSADMGKAIAFSSSVTST